LGGSLKKGPGFRGGIALGWGKEKLSSWCEDAGGGGGGKWAWNNHRGGSKQVERESAGRGARKKGSFPKAGIQDKVKNENGVWA